MNDTVSHRADSGRPFRVLYLLSGVNTRLGGPSVSAKNMWMAASRAGIYATCAFGIETPMTSDEKEAIDLLVQEGVTVRSFPFSAGPERFNHWGLSLKYLARLFSMAKDFDIVQAHGAWTINSVAGLIAAKLAGKRFILVPHESLAESDVAKGSNALRHRIKRSVKNLYLKFCDAIIIASETERRVTIGTSDCRSYVCHHPVMDERAARAPIRLWTSPIDPLRVGFLGRFDPKKNLELLIASIARCPGCQLVIGGAGTRDYERELRELAESSGAAHRIEWRGFIDIDGKDSFFRSIDVLAMPSVFECFGMAAAEAMICGVPIVVTASTGIAEIVQLFGCGIIVDPNAASVVDALKRLQTEANLLNTLSRRSLDAARTELTFGEYGKKLVAVYNEILS